MTISTRLKAASLAAIAATTTFAFTAAAPALADHHAEKAGPDIVATAMSTGMHGTLVTAVKAADLVETLQGDGPFTVFAPTDAAFGELPSGTVAALVKPENKPKLTQVLTYHVVAGKVTASDLIKMINDGGGYTYFDTVAGGKLLAMIEDGNVVITDAAGRKTTVATADVMTSNGVIHVTDGVFLPG